MPDETTTDVDIETETGTDDDPLRDAGKKALEAERRQRRAAEKAARDLETRVREFEERDKTDGEKHATRAQEAEARAARAERDALRYRVAAEKGLDLKLAGRLQGDTEADLLADADALLEMVGKTKPAPAPSFDGGARQPAATTDPAAAFNNAIRKAIVPS